MISEKMFKDCLKSIIALIEFEDCIYTDSGKSISLFDCNEIQAVRANLERLLSYCIGDTYKDLIGTDIDYFLYDLNYGNTDDPHICVDDTKYPLKNVDDLWNYFKSINPDVEDKCYKEPELRTYSDEEVEKIIYEFMKRES